MELVIEEGVKRIEAKAYQRGEFDELFLPSTLEEIGEFAFQHNHHLKVVVLPQGIKRIEHFAFSGIEAVFFIPETIEYVGREAFGRRSVLFFEGEEKDFQGYYDSYQDDSYPDSFYRGPSMGGTIEVFYYEVPCKRFFGKTYGDFLQYLSEHPNH